MRIVAVIGLVLAAAGICAFAWSVQVQGRGGEPREVVVVARDMTFVLPGAPGSPPNPTLRLKAGERIRLVLDNRDPGMKHDFVSPGLGLRTATVESGERGDYLITVPLERGEHDYFCSFHARMMRGRVVVE